MPPASLTYFSRRLRVVVLARPHSAKGPLLGTIAPRVIWSSARAIAPPANTVAVASTRPSKGVRMVVIFPPPTSEARPRIRQPCRVLPPREPVDANTDQPT